jgi:hypothetical protein
MKLRNPLFPCVYRFGTPIFDWLLYGRYRRENDEQCDRRAPDGRHRRLWFDCRARCISFTNAPRRAGVATTVDVHGC